jgi:hypothetical protein
MAGADNTAVRNVTLVLERVLLCVAGDPARRQLYYVLAGGTYDRRGFASGPPVVRRGPVAPEGALDPTAETQLWAGTFAPRTSAKLVLLFLESRSANHPTADLETRLRRAVSVSYSRVGVGAAIGCTLAALEPTEASTGDDRFVGGVAFELQDSGWNVRCIGVGFWRPSTLVRSQSPDAEVPYRAQIRLCDSRPACVSLRIDAAVKLGGSALEPCNYPYPAAAARSERRSFTSLAFPIGPSERAGGNENGA